MTIEWLGRHRLISILYKQPNRAIKFACPARTFSIVLIQLMAAIENPILQKNTGPKTENNPGQWISKP